MYNPGPGKAGSKLALVILGEQAQPLPRSEPVKEEDGYQVSHAAAVWNVITSLHALPNLSGELGKPRLLPVPTGLLFLPLAPDEVGWLPACPCPLPRGHKASCRKALAGQRAGAQLPKHLPQWPILYWEHWLGALDLDGCAALSLLVEAPFHREGRANYHVTASFTWF